MSCEGNVSTCTGEQQVTSRFPPAPTSMTFSDRFSQYSNGSTCAPDERQMKKAKSE